MTENNDLLRINLPTYQKAVELNKNCTVGKLREYLESVVHIPSQKQKIKLFGEDDARYLEERHNGLKCTDVGLDHESLIEVEGPTFATERSCGIASFSVQFSDGVVISLMPRCGLLWIERDCIDHVEDGDCYPCNSTGKIMMPLYCPLTPVLNHMSLAHDILCTFDIQGTKNCKYSMNFRRNQYPAAVIDMDQDGFPNEKMVRIMASDFGHGGRGLDHVTCQSRIVDPESQELTEEYGPSINSQYRFCIDNPQYSVCRMCAGPIFHGEHARDPMVWAWCCPGCRCQMHPKCAFDRFQELGEIVCHCPGCNGAGRQPIGRRVIDNPVFNPNADPGLHAIRNDLRNAVRQLYRARAEVREQINAEEQPPVVEEHVPPIDPAAFEQAMNNLMAEREGVDNEEPPPLEDDQVEEPQVDDPQFDDPHVDDRPPLNIIEDLLDAAARAINHREDQEDLEDNLPPLEEDESSYSSDDDIVEFGDDIMDLRVEGDLDSDIEEELYGAPQFGGPRYHVQRFPMRFIPPDEIPNAGPEVNDEVPEIPDDSLNSEDDDPVGPEELDIPDIESASVDSEDSEEMLRIMEDID